MAYYEFINLPACANWPDAAKTRIGTQDTKRNPWSESGNDDEVRISLSLSTTPNQKGWIGSAPEAAVVTITRKVKTHSGDAGQHSPNVEVGDLIFYRLALLSTSPSWTVQPSDEGKWPKAYLEFDAQNGVRLKVDLERLVVDSWRLDATDNLTALEETLVYRAWVVALSLPAGATVRLALGDSQSS
jgi:hypothetical protein